jgi:hypothetical protein
MKINKLFFVFAMVVCVLIEPYAQANQKCPEQDQESGHPRIVNIVNFIRLLEPRYAEVTQDVLYQTVVSQINLMNKYNLGGTFLLQYDALLDARYQKLLKSLPGSSFEVGAWWEIPQPLVEKAGLKWRGRYPWDWHANVGFSVGYTPREREKLVDVYMKDFKKIFGYYPKSVGSWYIDAYTLNYMYEKYGIVASCNCRDQIGTDGYTLWGGYWNQAYYPSKKDAYMPAQTEAGQIPVPIFRMLGSDHVPQYNAKLKKKRQGNVTLEPAYLYSGGDSTWVNWYFKEFAEGECMDFNYVQVGQENSFTWAEMGPGLKIQLPLVARLRNEKKVKVETLGQSGRWFRQHFKNTPVTSVTVKEDLPGSDCKTVWFDSRFFRTNLFWEHGTLRITDIHLFDENIQSEYQTKAEPSSKFFLYTLPFIDGYTVSPDKVAGLQLKAIVAGKEIAVEGGTPVVNDKQPGRLIITWPLKTIKGNLIIEMDEQKLQAKLESSVPTRWFFELAKADNEISQYKTISAKKIDCRFNQAEYPVKMLKGTIAQPGKNVVFRILPENNTLVLDFSRDVKP